MSILGLEKFPKIRELILGWSNMVRDTCPETHPFKLAEEKTRAVTKFKIWFDGFAAAVESTQTSWVLPEQWILLKKKIEEL